MILDWLVKIWKVEDDVGTVRGKYVNLIIPVSYGTTPRGLVVGTKRILGGAMYWGEVFKKAPIVFSCCEYLFPGAAQVESGYKTDISKNYPSPVIPSGTMNNSIQEAWVIKEKIKDNTLPHKVILVITGEIHSRSARFIWKKTFPQSVVIIRCIPWNFEFQANHPAILQRSAWRWFLASSVTGG